MRGPVLLACVLALACSCSPYGSGSFTCATNAECGADGTCIEGYCAFPDDVCPSHLRFGDRSGPNSGECIGEKMPDASVPMIDTPEGDHCYGTGLVVACFAAIPTGTQTISANTSINTDNGPCATLTSSSPWCVVAAETITINAGVTLRATGSRPLVLVATGSISVMGYIDASSHRGGGTGAGGDMSGCNGGTQPAGTSGGAGGSFGGVGGAGTDVGGAGMPGAKPTITALRGGCPGQDGPGLGGGARGHGGGAVYLIASSITVGGTIDASGSGGTNAAGFSNTGGGGAGAGGFIGLEATTVGVTGSVFANGGGGGEGSGTSSTGSPGQDPMAALTAALGGGDTSSYGANGGNGSVGATLNGSPGAAGCTTPCTTPGAGGGGGGGAGMIRVVPGQTLGGSVSPSP